MTDPLSPAAEAVLDAFFNSFIENPDMSFSGDRNGLAAALRAAALYCKQDRRVLMTIADELDSLAQLQRQ